MSLPYFFAANLEQGVTEFVLNEETSKHVVQVLRMQQGAPLHLTNGKGGLFTATIADPNKKSCAVAIAGFTYQPPSPQKVVIGISLLKNAHRLEWFLEKATEIGVAEIIPLLCTRTEKQHFRTERMQGIVVSAMLQSQQTWLPLLHEPQKVAACIRHYKSTINHKLIAHCVDAVPRQTLIAAAPPEDVVVLIGPEGDFTIDEIEMALQGGFSAVSLGNTRLRTETAGMVAAVILCSP